MTRSGGRLLVDSLGMELGCAGSTMILSVKRFTIIVIAVDAPGGVRTEIWSAIAAGARTRMSPPKSRPPQTPAGAKTRPSTVPISAVE